MRKATTADRSLIVNIISKAFSENRSVNYVIRKKDLGSNIRSIEKLVDYAFKVCLHNGEVWLNDKNQGCVMFQRPHEKKFSITSLLWDVQLAFRCIGIFRIAKVLKRESLIKKHHPDEPFLHLWFIGVLPDFQGEGTGTSLLKLTREKAGLANIPIYLETSVEKNLRWYADHDFEIYNTINFEDHKLYMLRSKE